MCCKLLPVVFNPNYSFKSISQLLPSKQIYQYIKYNDKSPKKSLSLKNKRLLTRLELMGNAYT